MGYTNNRMSYAFEEGEEMGIVTDLLPAKRFFDAAGRAYSTIALAIEARYPYLPGIPALFSQFADETEEDAETISAWNRRVAATAPVFADEFDEETALPGQPPEIDAGTFVKTKFDENPTAKAAFDIMAEAETHMDRYIDGVKQQQQQCGEVDGFNVMSRLQQRVVKRFEKLDRFARRLNHSDETYSLIIIDVLLESIIN